MATSKVLEVLCPNGRRNKVKTTPSMAVLEVNLSLAEALSYSRNNDPFTPSLKIYRFMKFNLH